MKNILKENKLVLFVTFLPFLITLFYYNRLPEKVAIHFDYNNQVDSFLGKNIFILLPLAIFFLQLIVLWLSEKKGATSQPIFPILTWIIPCIAFLATGVSIGYSVYHQTNILLLMPFFLGIMFIALGNSLPKITQNQTVGIRLPWTLNSTLNWYYTHRFTGYVWVIAGFLMILLALSPLNVLWSLAMIFIAVIIPVIYSYSLAKKGI